MIRSAFLTLATTLFGIATLTAQGNGWIPVNNGLGGGEILSLQFAADGSLLAGTPAGIYRVESLDQTNPASSRWTIVDSLPLAWSIQRSQDGTLYATNGMVVHRSTDHGQTWSYVVRGNIKFIAGFDSDGLLYYDHDTRNAIHVRADGTVVEGTSFTLSTTDNRTIGREPLVDPSVYNGQDGGILRHARAPFGIDAIAVIEKGNLAGSHIDNAPYPGERNASSYVRISTDSVVTFHSDGVKRSTDGGTTWSRVSGIGFNNGIASLNGTLYAWNQAYQAPAILYRSDDFGTTWEPCQTLSYNPVAVAGPNGELIVAGYEDVYLLRSCEEGWIRFSDGLNAGHITNLVEGPDGTLYTTRFRSRDVFDGFHTSSLTLYASSDGGDTWDELIDDINDLLGIDASSNVYVRVDSVPEVGDDPHATILQSRDGGETWTHLLHPTGSYSYHFYGATDPEPIAPASFSSTPSGIVRIGLIGRDEGKAPCNLYESLDGGETFNCWEIGMNDPHLRAVSYRALDDTNQLVWVERTVGDPGFEVVVETLIYHMNVFTGELTKMRKPTRTIWAIDSVGTYYSLSLKNIYRSYDQGITWEDFPLSTDFHGEWHYTGFSTGRVNELFYTGVCEGELWINRNRLKYDRLLRSGDGGATWTEIVEPVSSIPENTGRVGNNLPVQGPGNLLLDTLINYSRYLPPPLEDKISSYDAFAWSTDNGSTWEVAEQWPLNSVDVSAILYTSKNVTYIGTRGAGLFRMETPLSDLREGQPVHTGFGLELLPMPVLNHARLYFTIDESSQASIVLYNSLGQQVRTIDTGQPQPGTNIIPVDFSDLPAGAYFLELVTEAHRKALPVLVR